MSAGIYNFIVERGTDCIRQFQWADVDSQPIDITGWLAHLQVRDSKDSSAPVLIEYWSGDVTQLVAQVGVINIPNLVITPTLGVITLWIPANTSLALPWIYANYDLQLISPRGYTKKLIYGAISVLPSVTQN